MVDDDFPAELLLDGTITKDSRSCVMQFAHVLLLLLLISDGCSCGDGWI
jgi:hypothetical protein